MHKAINTDSKQPIFITIIAILLLLTLAAVFLFSGISKLFAFEQLMWNFMDVGITHMALAGILARLFIALELLLGCFLLLQLYLRSFTYPAVMAMLVGFSVYLMFLIQTQGDNGNCGCFGEAYAMRPSAGILKNIGLLGIAALLWRYFPGRSYKNSIYIAMMAIMLSLMTPFVVIPLSRQSQPTVTQADINLQPLYEEAAKPTVDLRKGKHIVAFMSLSCPHCKKAAFLFHILKKQHPELPLYMVLAGDDADEKNFFEETKSMSVPHLRFKNMDAFMQYAKEGVPAIFYINNSVIERKANYFQLDPGYMSTWLKQ